MARLDRATKPRWGRMTAHEMVCHVTDSFAAIAGEKYASPATGLFERTVMTWVALHAPLPWPRNVPTRPEIEQGKGGTPPSDWDADLAKARITLLAFAQREAFLPHPIFGELTRAEYMIWGFRHVDHHLRQFRV